MQAMQADEVLERFWDGSLPVNIGKITTALGIRVQRDALDDHSGEIELTDIGPVITLNRDDPVPRRRFTLAHEIGHFCLGHLSKTTRQFRDSQAGMQNARDWNEVSANRFAADLLMPEAAVSYVMKNGLAKSLDEMASEFFGVSRQAMEIRLRVLGLL